jgi:hypothetical protein
MRKTIISFITAIVLDVAGVALWRVFNPGPLAFAGGTSVPLADYTPPIRRHSRGS